MKKLIYLSVCTLFVFFANISCEKEKVSNESTVENPEAVWLTPNGYVIPYSQKNNWKSYLKKELTEMNNKFKPVKYYGSRRCSRDTFKCGLECIEVSSQSDCTKESACAPCMNCGC